MRIAPILLAVVLLPALANAQRGVPQGGFPSWQERMMQVFANRARSDPSSEQFNSCGGTTVRPPLIWNYNMNRASRFHCANLNKNGSSLQHNSPCTLVSNISDLFAPNGTCDGSASCACVGGALSCNTTCSSPWDRMALFSCPGGGRAENVARGYGDPLAAHNGWMNSSGHCSNILGSYVSFGGGSDGSFWTQKFSSSGTVSGTLIAGGHFPRLVASSATSIAFRVNYYDTRGAPLSGEVNIDGQCTQMDLERGSDTNGTHLATVSLSGTGCRRYVFVFEDPAGETVFLPETGSYGVGGSGCEDWAPETPAMCNGNGADTTPPQVSIVQPIDGQEVFGVFRIVAEASDDVGVARVGFFVDGESIGTSQMEPFQVYWDTGGWILEEPTIVARAADLAGNEAESDPVTVRVIDDSHSGGSLVVRIVSPEDGTQVAQRDLWVVAEVEVEAEVGVATVSFEVDGEVVSTNDQEPWTVGIDLMAFAPGERVITAVAEDTAGRIARSGPVRVELVDELAVAGDCGCASGAKGMELAFLFVILIGFALRGTARRHS